MINLIFCAVIHGLGLLATGTHLPGAVAWAFLAGINEAKHANLHKAILSWKA